MAIIDHSNFVVDGEKVFAWEYPQKNLSANTMLNVRQGQEALFLLGGQIQAKYGPNGARPHVLDTSNVPVVRRFFGIPFGGSNPLLASVWFINKADIVNFSVKTDTFLVKDPAKPQGFPAVATAVFGLRVVEAEPFFLKLVNSKHHYDAYDMTQAVQGRILREVSEKIAMAIESMQLDVAELSSRLGTLSRNVEYACAQFVSQWGLEFVDFNIKITQDTSREGMLLASGYGTDLNTFERQRMLDIQEKAMENVADGQTGAAGLLVAMTMANNMYPRSQAYAPPVRVVPESSGNQGKQHTPENTNRIKSVFCANCSNKYSSDLNFCSSCGKKYTPCPQCQSDTSVDARRCANCGFNIQATHQRVCRNCQTPIAPGVAFCPGCGSPVSEGKCINCGAALSGEKFCPMCGTQNKH